MSSEFLYHSVDAAHIRNIGEESVSNKIQAVIELVKNAYDADATSCTVTFIGEMGRHKKIKIGTIIIEDNGIGMTRKDLKDKFMKVGTGSKIREKESPILKRRVSGEKGMGHYSVQRLGDYAIIKTTPINYSGRLFADSDKKTLSLDLDWTQYTEGKEFESIGNKLQKLKREKRGTKIEITGLRDAWNADGDENDLTLLSRNLGSLLLPKRLQGTAKEQFSIKLETMGFDAYIPKIEAALLKISPFKIVVTLRDKKINYSVFEYVKKQNKHIELPTDGRINVKDAICGNADVEIHWFPGNPSDWAPGFMRVDSLRRQLDESRGVKIYNDKIRIMPYGEKDDDWLHLGTRKSGAASGGKVRNVHLVGFVKLSRKGNPKIIETTTRQAVRENEEFHSLKKVMIRIIEELEANARVVRKDANKSPANKALVNIKKIQAKIKKLPIYKDEISEYTKVLSEIARDVTLTKQQASENEEELSSNIEMYRNLSTVGIQTLAFNHEIINPINFVNGSLENILSNKKPISSEKIKGDLEDCFEQTQNALSWASFVKEFSGLLIGGQKATRKTSMINLEKMLTDIAKGFSSIFETVDIDMKEPKFVGSIPKIKMNKAALESILINLTSNSIRSLKRVDRNRHIRTEISKTNSDIVIEFEDNGYGIPDDVKSRIFRPFFTTYTDVEDQGTGMGLTIIKEIVEVVYQGSVRLKKTICEEDEEGKGMTIFEIKLPKGRVGL